MKTASWYTWRGEGRIGISVGTPRGMPGGYRLYRPLNPRRDMLEMSKPEYERIYFGMLAQLDPQKAWDDLHRLVGPGVEPVMLCYERPPFSAGNWCHRRMVADWFKQTLGQDVPEHGDNPGLI